VEEGKDNKGRKNLSSRKRTRRRNKGRRADEIS
jgi:hypothetical protein